VRKLVVCAALVLIAKPAEVEAGFVFRTFDVPGAIHTVATGINNAGQVVGFFDVVTGPDTTATHGFLNAGGMLSTLDVPFPGADVTRAWGINNKGQIVGSFSDATGMHGFLDTRGRFTTLDVPGASGDRTLPLAINDRGQIVGSFHNKDLPTVSGFLKSGSKFTTLNVPGAYNTVASGINNAGQIVGQYSLGTPFVQPGFLYANGVFTTLNVGYVDIANINNVGQIAGTFDDATGQHGFLLTGSDLTIIDVPGASNTYVSGINDFGEVAGYWNENGVPGSHGFVAVSTPEPASWISLCTGAAIIVGYGWQRKRLRRDAARC
jgi:probable HAF family extracellular repeat protein